jgi:hypothetical protein
LPEADAMDDQNRLRLNRIAERQAKRAAQAPKQPDAKTGAADADPDFLASFARVRDDVLRPVMAEVGVQLKSSGYSFRISPGGDEASPAVELRILMADRGDSKDTIRFLARKDATKGWQVIAELELKRSPIELTRFEVTDEITRDVAEQLIVDAVEQMFASTGPTPPSEAPDLVRPSAAVSPPAQSPHVTSSQPTSEVPVIDSSAMPTPAFFVAANASRTASLDTPPPIVARGGDTPEGCVGPQAMGETENVDIRAFKKPALPFVKGDPAPAFFAAADTARTDARLATSDGDGNETLTLPTIENHVTSVQETAEVDVRMFRKAPLPFAKADPTSSMSLEQYAAFYAELAVFPDRTTSILQRYGLAAVKARQALDEAFARRFHADPAEERRWRALVHHYENWYRRESPK